MQPSTDTGCHSETPHCVVHSIMRRSREIGLVFPKLMCRLFDTLMRPTFTYGSEIWGVELGLLDHEKAGSVAYAVEKVHLQYLKRNLGVRKGTTSTLVRGEFGRHPVLMNIWFLIIKYFFRLEELNGGRVLRCAFERGKFLAFQGVGFISQTKVFGRYHIFMKSKAPCS
jgi:hypothetical protein